MAITVNSSQASGNVGTTGTPSTKDYLWNIGAVSVGQYVLIHSSMGSSTAVTSLTDNLGNTWSAIVSIFDAVYGNQVAWGCKIANAGTSTIDLLTNTANDGCNFSALNLSGVDPTTPVVTSSSIHTTFGTSQDASPLTFATTVLLAGMFSGTGYSGSTQAPTVQGGWSSIRQTGTSSSIVTVWNTSITSGASPYTIHVDYPGAAYGVVCSVALLPASGGGAFDPSASHISKQAPEPVRRLSAQLFPSFFPPNNGITAAVAPNITPSWFPDAVQRPRYLVTEQQAFAGPTLPDIRKTQWAAATFPDATDRARMRPSAQMFQSPEPIVVERAIVYFDGIEPDWIARRLMLPTAQQFAPVLPPAPDTRTVPWSAATAPDRIESPMMRASAQLAQSPRELVLERPFPYADGIEPDAVRRPVLATSDQQAVAAPPPLPDARTFQYADGIEPDSVRRPMMHPAEQRAFGDPTASWALAPPAPAITPPSWPDSVPRPMYPAARQQAFAITTTTDRPYPYADGIEPDSIRRPMMAAAEQQAAWAPPLPAIVVAVPTLTSAAYPDAVRRPAMPAGEQQAFTRGTAPERQAAFSAAYFPDSVPRAFMPVRVMPFFTTSPLPDATRVPYFGAIVPDALRRPQFHASEQAFYAGLLPAPTVVAAPFIGGWFSDYLPRVQFGAYQQLSFFYRAYPTAPGGIALLISAADHTSPLARAGDSSRIIATAGDHGVRVRTSDS